MNIDGRPSTVHLLPEGLEVRVVQRAAMECRRQADADELPLPHDDLAPAAEVGLQR